MTIYLLKHRQPGKGPYVRALDGSEDCYMAFTNMLEAHAEAKRQNKLYGLNCIAVAFPVEDEQEIK